MTKQQAYDLAEKEVTTEGYVSTFVVYGRAMEIYAAAFAEWVENKYMQTHREDETKVWVEVYKSECPSDREPEYTTAELITEFEKK